MRRLTINEVATPDAGALAGKRGVVLSMSAAVAEKLMTASAASTYGLVESLSARSTVPWQPAHRRRGNFEEGFLAAKICLISWRGRRHLRERPRWRNASNRGA